MNRSAVLWNRLALAASARSVPYSFSVARSIAERDADEWHAACGGHVDAVMDPRFLKTMENAMTADTRFHNVVFRDAAGTPCAAALLSLYTIDGFLFASERWKNVGRQIRRLLPSFLKTPMLLCGCPPSTGESHLRMVAGCDHRGILRQLDRLMLRMAHRQHAPFLVFKEFMPSESSRMDALLELGYVRVDSLPMNYFPTRFADFDHFLTSLRSHYRRRIVLSRRKFQRAGLRVEHRRGSNEELNGDTIHRLYLNVLNRAEVRFECLPAEFFRELARQFGQDAVFTFIRRDRQIVAFVCGLFHRQDYHNLFCGLDYKYNAESYLYFNLMYEDIDYALRHGARSIYVGQTADDFKARIGCYREGRCFYVKARDNLLHFVPRLLSPFLFPPVPPLPQYNVFHAESISEVAAARRAAPE